MAQQTLASNDRDAVPEHGDEGLIAVMPETLANKIAAGEVVQRPASVAKELIENALDAGATEVELIVKKAGRALVHVIDDGSGMGPPDARRCFRRHATSKVRAADDLQRLRTLGFRGEALASIGAVAQVELKTKRPGDAAGLRVRVEGGEEVEAAPCATPTGTSIAVRNLFYNVPARRNFLKTDATEFKHIVETFQQQALAHPGVAFRLVHNDNEVFRLARTVGRAEVDSGEKDDFFAALHQRVEDLLGEDRADGLRRVEDEASYLGVRGFAGAPVRGRRSRREQFLFVNGRYVENRYLAHAVKTAYGSLLEDGVFPFFALFLALDPARVDVNVHPTKAEVKFEDKSGVYGLVREAVRTALSEEELDAPQFENRPRSFSSTATDDDDGASEEDGGLPRANLGGPSPARTPRDDDRGGSGAATSRPARSTATPPAPAKKRSPTPTDAFSAGDLSEKLYAPPEEERAEPNAPSAEEAFSEERACWPVGGRFVVVPQQARLLVVDAPAAHRRVLYERARRHLAEEEAEHPSQQQLFPQTVDVPASDVALLDELLPDLRRMGFDIRKLSGRTVALRGVPVGARGEAEALFEEVLEEYRTLGTTDGEARADRLAQSLARRGAVGPEVQLSQEEARALVAALFDCEMPYADPAGHPTMLRMTPAELAEQFQQ